MNRWLGLLAGMALIGGLGVAQAQTLGTAQTYSNIVFAFSTTLKSGSADYTVCNELRVDATGDFVHSTKFVVYGVLNCASSGTGYTAAGSGYIGSNDSINMSLLLGTGLYLQCPTLVNLVGNCDINNAAGVKVGSASLAVK